MKFNLNFIFIVLFFLYWKIQLKEFFRCEIAKMYKTKKLNSVAFSPQANYTYRATAACRRS
jgi:hypothetical protein